MSDVISIVQILQLPPLTMWFGDIDNGESLTSVQ